MHDSVCTASYCTPSHAASSIRYLVSVAAVSGVGCSDVSEIDCYTVEKQPPMVTGVTVNRLNGTAMNVSWTPIHKAQSNGFLQSYIVTYSVVTAAPNSKRQGNDIVQQETVSSDKSNVVVGGLDPASMYIVDVTASGSGGTSERECDCYYLDGCSLAANYISLCPYSLCSDHHLPHTLSVVPAQAHQHQQLS